MADSTVWWLLAGVAIAIELLSGTFYLVMIAIGLMSAALAAHAGLSLTQQLALAALLGGGSVVAWRAYRLRSATQPQQADLALQLDVGETVMVEHWQPDGSSTVRHRGANWQASLTPGKPHRAGSHRIVQLAGNRLVLEPV